MVIIDIRHVRVNEEEYIQYLEALAKLWGNECYMPLDLVRFVLP